VVNECINNSTAGMTKEVLSSLLALIFIYLIAIRPFLAFLKGFISGMK
jgi:hypothetical protein